MHPKQKQHFYNNDYFADEIKFWVNIEIIK